MPHGVKGSGKAAPAKKAPISKKAKIANSAPAKKPCKACLSVKERIALADARIERLTIINDTRKALIDKTEATLNARKAALAKSITALEKQR